MFDFKDNPEEVFYLYNRLRDSGSTYNFSHRFTELRHNQHNFTHASPLKAIITNDYYNVRSNSNGLRYTLKNVTDTTTRTSEITLTAKRYDTIAAFHSALQTKLTTQLTADAVALSGAGAAITSTVESVDDYQTKISFTVTGTTDTYQLLLLKAEKAPDANLANDVERLAGFADSANKAEFPSSFAATVTSPYAYDVNHIKFIKVYCDLGKAYHRGCFAIVPIQGVTTRGMEQSDFHADRRHDAFPLASKRVTSIRVQASDMNDQLLEGNGHLQLMFKLLREEKVTEYGKRVRLV